MFTGLRAEISKVSSLNPLCVKSLCQLLSTRTERLLIR